MRCHEARKFLGPYLDSELDAKTSLEIEQHLETCRECAQYFGAEQKLDQHIFSILRQGQKTGPLWERVESQIKASGFWATVRRFPRLMRIGLATAMVLFLTLMLWPKTHRMELASAIEKDHRAYVEGYLTAEFTGALPENLAPKLAGRLDAAAFSTLPVSASFRADGARLCHLSGVPVAWMMARCDNVPVSWIVLKKAELDRFPQAKRRFERGQPVVCIRTGRFQFAARVVGQHVVCAIADAPKAQLEELLKSVPDSG